jgi:hypothetical protein
MTEETKVRKARKPKESDPTVVTVGSMTKLTGGVINLEQVANYAVQELELRIDKAEQNKKAELAKLYEEISNFIRENRYKQFNKETIKDEFDAKIKTAVSIFGLDKYIISLNEKTKSILEALTPDGRSRFNLSLKSLHIGVRGDDDEEDYDDDFHMEFMVNPEILNKIPFFKDYDDDFHMEFMVNPEILNKIPFFKDYNDKINGFAVAYKKATEELRLIQEQKSNVKNDGKQLHLEVMKAEISKSANGKALMKEICALVKGSDTMKFLASNT